MLKDGWGLRSAGVASAARPSCSQIEQQFRYSAQRLAASVFSKQRWRQAGQHRHDRRVRHPCRFRSAFRHDDPPCRRNPALLQRRRRRRVMHIMVLPGTLGQLQGGKRPNASRYPPSAPEWPAHYQENRARDAQHEAADGERQEPPCVEIFVVLPIHNVETPEEVV